MKISQSTRRRPGRPPGGELEEGERRARILATALELFQRRGFAAVTISEVAAAVGITNAAVHYHFTTKAALYAAVMRFVLEGIRRGIAAMAAAPGPIAPKLHRLTTFAIVSLQSNADLDTMMRDADEHLSAAQRQEIDAAYHEVIDALAGLMRDGVARGELADADPALLAHAFWHLLAGFAGRAGAVSGYQGRPDVAAKVIQLFLNGAAQRGRDTRDEETR